MFDKITSDMEKALAEPFPADEIKYKPELTKKKDGSEYQRNGQRVAKCSPYIDARAVMNRLDAVVGVGGWSDEYVPLSGVNVECRLTVLGVTKADVGEASGTGSFADPLKTAYSDALKRAAVKFGVGRHLYDMPMQWLPYDGYTVTTPQKSASRGEVAGDSRGDMSPQNQKQREAYRPTAPQNQQREAYRPKINSHLDKLASERILKYGDVTKLLMVATGQTLADINEKVGELDLPDAFKLEGGQAISRDGADKLVDHVLG